MPLRRHHSAGTSMAWKIQCSQLKKDSLLTSAGTSMAWKIQCSQLKKDSLLPTEAKTLSKGAPHLLLTPSELYTNTTARLKRTETPISKRHNMCIRQNRRKRTQQARTVHKDLPRSLFPSVSSHKRRDWTTRPIPPGFKWWWRRAIFFIASC